jgi:hypothetical protein
MLCCLSKNLDAVTVTELAVSPRWKQEFHDISFQVFAGFREIPLVLYEPD